MKRTIFRALAFCLLLLLLFPLTLSVSSAEENTATPSLEEVGAAYLYHLERGTAVLQKNESDPIGAGSTVKIMAGLLFCEALANRLSEKIEITPDLIAAVPAAPGYALRIEMGDVFTAEQLLYAALCGSFNDAYYILAAYTYGSTNALLSKMNRRAGELGAQDTLFRDITGIQGTSQTTPRDLCRIAVEAYENDLYMRFCDTEAYVLNTQRIVRTIYNRNALISTQGGTVTKYYDKNCYGMSAGSTPEDGNCVVTAAKHADATYLCITLGGKETDNTEFGYVVAKRMIGWVSDTFAYIEVLSSDKDVASIPVEVSDLVTEIPLRTRESYAAYIPRGTNIEKEITFSIRLESDTLEAPVEKDTFVGYVAIVYQGQTLKTLPLYTTASAERSNFIGAMRLMQDMIGNRAVLVGIIFFVLSMTVWIITEVSISRRRKHRWDKYFSSKIELPREKRSSPSQAPSKHPASKKNHTDGSRR